MLEVKLRSDCSRLDVKYSLWSDQIASMLKVVEVLLVTTILLTPAFSPCLMTFKVPCSATYQKISFEFRLSIGS